MLIKSHKSKTHYILAIISSVLNALSMTFESLDFLAWFGFSFIFFAFLEYNLSKKDIFKTFFMYGAIYNFILLYWLIHLHPLTWLGYTPFQSLVLTILAYVSLSLFEALFYGFIGKTLLYNSRNNLLYKCISLVAIILLIEWIREMTFLGFPWGRIAISQFNNLNLIQSANLFGILFVSFIILTVNLLISLFIYKIFDSNKKAYIYLAVAIIVFLSNYTYGMISNSNINLEKSDKLKVAIIQGNISVSDKWRNDKLEYTKNAYIDTTIKASKLSPDVIFWPESAIPVNFSKNTETVLELKAFSKTLSIPIITGAIRYGDDGLNRNSIVLLEDGIVKEPYDKRHPVPFGEFIPFSKYIYKLFPDFADSKIATNDLVAGTISSTIKIDSYYFGPLVCYDSIFPTLARESKSNGANVLFVASNDSWYKNSKALTQHAAQSVFRAVENGCYLVRAANTGISCIIEPNGFIKKETKPQTKTFIIDEIQKNNNQTLYTKGGYYFPHILFALYLIFAIYLFTKTKNSPSIR